LRNEGGDEWDVAGMQNAGAAEAQTPVYWCYVCGHSVLRAKRGGDRCCTRNGSVVRIVGETRGMCEAGCTGAVWARRGGCARRRGMCETRGAGRGGGGGARRGGRAGRGGWGGEGGGDGGAGGVWGRGGGCGRRGGCARPDARALVRFAKRRGTGSAQGILKTKRAGCRSPNAGVLVLRARVFGASCVTASAGAVYETAGDGKCTRGSVYETRGAADARTTHAVRETAGVERSAAGGIGDAACVRGSDVARRVSFVGF